MRRLKQHGRIRIGWPNHRSRVWIGRPNHPGRIRMGWPNYHGRVWIGWPNHPGRVRDIFWLNHHFRIRMVWPSRHGRIREYFGRITISESEETAESPWPNPNGIAAVRNLAYRSASSGPWCVRCLGTCPAWLGSWLGAHRCPEQPRLGARRLSHPFCKLTGSFWSFNSDKKMVSIAAPLYSFLRNRSEAKTKTPILSENHLILKHGSPLLYSSFIIFLKIFTFYFLLFTFFNFWFLF